MRFPRVHNPIFFLCIALTLGGWGWPRATWGQADGSRFVDSLFNALTLREKIGQLFVVVPSADNALEAYDHVADVVERYAPGGMIFTSLRLADSVRMSPRLQAFSRVPLWNAMDGDASAHDVALLDPWLLQAATSDSLLYVVGKAVAAQLKRHGIHIYMLPAVGSLASLTMGEGSGSSSFAQMAPFVKGLREKGILAYAKNASLFGAGRKRDDAVADEAFAARMPRNAFVDIDGLALSCPPASFSIKRWKRKAKLKKPVWMAACDATPTEDPWWSEAAFLLAADGAIIVRPDALPKALRRMENVIRQHNGLQRKLDRKVKAMLRRKRAAGLFAESDASPLPDRAHTAWLAEQLAEEAITVAARQPHRIPVHDLYDKSFASLSIGTGRTEAFTRYLSKFTPFTHYTLSALRDTLSFARALSGFEIVVVALYDVDPELRQGVIAWLNRFPMRHRLILCVFSNPYEIEDLREVKNVVIAYTDADPVPRLTAQLLFGVYSGKGVLPVNVNTWLRRGQRMPNGTLDRLGYGLPEAQGMDGGTLAQIDRVVETAIDSGAMPGCGVLVARRGKVVFEKYYGSYTYARTHPVTENTIYDLASITKVAATLNAVMLLYDRGRIDIDAKASVYLPTLRGTDKADCILKDILTHQAGLWPFVPFWRRTVPDMTTRLSYYRSQRSDAYPLQVSRHLFGRRALRDSLWQWTIEAPMRDKDPRMPYDYTYSDMGFYMLHRIVERLADQPMEDFLEHRLYRPMGVYTMGYLPLRWAEASRIAPTEIDRAFRNDTIVGVVHDQGAAMRGGVAGHAGLFSGANDLAKMAQMWLQRGRYGGVRYIKESTVRKFTAQYYLSNRRGLGWDKPMVGQWDGPTSLYVSPATFGHTGFTGAAVWVDPTFDLVYVFLTNRTYPDAENKIFLELNVRPRVQDIIYRSIFEYCKYVTDK